MKTYKVKREIKLIYKGQNNVTLIVLYWISQKWNTICNTKITWDYMEVISTCKFFLRKK